MERKKTEFFIHIGTWKTGSSTIQYNLEKNKAALRDEGFIYLSKKEKMVINDGIIRNFTKPEKDYIEKSREKLSGLLNKYRTKNPDSRFIASAEEFSGNPFEGFKNAEQVADNIFQITEGFDLDIKIIVYLRRQDDFFESLYTQSIHLGEHHSFDKFLDKFNASHFNWFTLIKAYEKYFGKSNIRIRRYHQAYLPDKNSLLQDFGKVIGCNLFSDYGMTVSKNKGLTRDALEITRLTNQHLDEEGRYQLRNIFQMINSKKPYEKYAYFTADERNDFLNRYEHSNAKLAVEYLDDETGVLFPPPNQTDTSLTYDGLNIEAVVVNFSKALLLVEQRAKRDNARLARISRDRLLRYKLRKIISGLLDRRPDLKDKIRRLLGR